MQVRKVRGMEVSQAFWFWPDGSVTLVALSVLCVILPTTPRTQNASITTCVASLQYPDAVNVPYVVF